MTTAPPPYPHIRNLSAGHIGPQTLMFAYDGAMFNGKKTGLSEGGTWRSSDGRRAGADPAVAQQAERAKPLHVCQGCRLPGPILGVGLHALGLLFQFLELPLCQRSRR